MRYPPGTLPAQETTTRPCGVTTSEGSCSLDDAGDVERIPPCAATFMTPESRASVPVPASSPVVEMGPGVPVSAAPPSDAGKTSGLGPGDTTVWVLHAARG